MVLAQAAGMTDDEAKTMTAGVTVARDDISTDDDVVDSTHKQAWLHLTLAVKALDSKLARI